MSLRGAVVDWCLIVSTAALWTGAQGGFHIGTMTGLLPPHYGYSAYAACVLLFLTPFPLLQGWGALALLASGNRAAWVGALAAWTWAGGRRRALLAAFLCVLGVVGGLAVKPNGAKNDSDRVIIWKTVAGVVREYPRGFGHGFSMGVNGLEIGHAHSDVLEIALVYGLGPAALAVLLVAWGFYRAPESPAKAALVALTAQSVIDNRVTTSYACAGLYAALWLVAFSRREQPSERTL